MLNFRIGKKYRRRTGSLIYTVLSIETMPMCKYGNIVKFDKGSDVWERTGTVIFDSATDADIIEEVKEDEMKIEVGKLYKLANGYKAYIHSLLPENAAAVRPYLGYITSPNGVYACQDEWDENGECRTHSYNIVEEWKEPKSGAYYMNVYSNNDGTYITVGLNDSRQHANDRSSSKNFKRIACVRVEWKEGQFDE